MSAFNYSQPANAMTHTTDRSRDGNREGLHSKSRKREKSSVGRDIRTSVRPSLPVTRGVP